MKNFLPIENTHSPFSVTQDLSFSAVEIFDFEFYKNQVVEKMTYFTNQTQEQFIIFFKQLYCLALLQAIYRSGNVSEFINNNENALSYMSASPPNLNKFLYESKRYLHPEVNHFISLKRSSQISSENLQKIWDLTKLYITDLQNISRGLINPVYEYQTLKKTIHHYIQMQQHLYKPILDNEQSLIEASQKIFLDEESRGFLNHLEYQYSSTSSDENKGDRGLSKHESDLDDDYGQFVDIENNQDHSVFVYMVKIQDAPSNVPSKHDTINEVRQLFTETGSSNYRLFFNKAAFELRAANCFMNEGSDEQEKGIVYQFT